MDGGPRQSVGAPKAAIRSDESHGRSGLSMLLIGSVTNKVLTQAKTPVLVCQ